MTNQIDDNTVPPAESLINEGSEGSTSPTEPPPNEPRWGEPGYGDSRSTMPPEWSLKNFNGIEYGSLEVQLVLQTRITGLFKPGVLFLSMTSILESCLQFFPSQIVTSQSNVVDHVEFAIKTLVEQKVLVRRVGLSISTHRKLHEEIAYSVYGRPLVNGDLLALEETQIFENLSKVTADLVAIRDFARTVHEREQPYSSVEVGVMLELLGSAQKHLQRIKDNLAKTLPE